ncbi:MAG: hypothetical protein OER56_01690 [Hyphomicrobiales bacterium]|nr:hypothetical protein [Hyphomicrobiales bacterium]
MTTPEIWLKACGRVDTMEEQHEPFKPCVVHYEDSDKLEFVATDEFHIYESVPDGSVDIIKNVNGHIVGLVIHDWSKHPANGADLKSSEAETLARALNAKYGQGLIKG